MLTQKTTRRLLTALLAVILVLVPSATVFAEEIKGIVQVSDYLNVRNAADDDAEILEELHNGDQVTVVGETDGWYRVVGDHDGWVSAKYVALVPKQDEAGNAEETAGQTENGGEQAGEENAAPQEQAQQQQAQPQQEQPAAEDGKPKYDPSNEDMRLLAALIQCECGAGTYDGKLAVGAVVMNRAKTYGGIREAIYAPYQFGPARSGKLDTTLALNAIDAISMQAAADAMSGISNIGVATHFKNVNSGQAGIVAGNHVFW